MSVAETPLWPNALDAEEALLGSILIDLNALLAARILKPEILDLLKASAEPMSPKQIAEALGKNVNTVRTLLLRMARAGDIVTPSFGKYALMASPVNSVNSVNSSLIEEEAAEERTPESLASSKLTMREDGHH